MSLSHLIKEISDLVDDKLVVAAVETPSPGGLLLSPVEFDLYELNADALDLKFMTPFKVLKFLKSKLGYRRLQEGDRVTAHYRPHESNPLVEYFDGFRGEVVGTDEIGRPWVKFRDQDWTRALLTSKSKSKSGISPLESQEENVQPRLLALRLDPLDTQSYRKQLAALGYVYPRADVLSKNWMHILPKSTSPNIDIYEEGDIDFDGPDEDEGEAEKQAYLYDPLVTDLVSMSHEQIRYVLDNAEDFLLDLPEDEDYIPEKDKPNFIDWNPPEGHSTGSLKRLVEILPELEVEAKVSVPSASNPLSGIKGAKSKKLWRELMTSPKFLKHLRSRPPAAQWALAHHVHVIRSNKHGVQPFGYWTGEHQKKFDARNKAIQKSIHHKREFAKAHGGETPEQYRKRTGKCPRGFIYIKEKNRCIHKL